MARIEEPTLGFIESHPAQAARVLEQLPRDEAVALVCSVPMRLAVPVVRAMSAFTAARCLEIMPPERASGLIQRLGLHATTSILRYLSPDRREALLAGLPTASAVACRLLLGYPEDTVGSMVDLSVLAMVPQTRVADALARIGRAADDPGDFVYVVSDSGELVGQLRIAEMLRSGDRDQAIGALMHNAPAILSAQLSLAAAREHAAWNGHPTLPVAERNGGFLGVLHHHVLTQPARRSAGPRSATGLQDTAAALGTAYWSLFDGLIRAAVSAMPVTQSAQDRAAP